ncbi:mucin-2 [Amyelois transitella]|uniref:mucin-2 n=1 Tax=Amyelois transitella TaxID=680683 RepID=UPI00299036E6|nr:mucin-2 [Amyelois transitella]XP_060801438.1 mucin-2 [Amyelois transitella]
MRAPPYLLLVVACAVASETSVNEERGSKLPYVADALGNELPRPSSLPATVGSPVNLLTPDRYEFYTFDESGELVKRLMTLEEIQAIVAAGEEAEGLVTFANDNQPTIAFNFSQPPYNKVHNVVTNVQNVLKAQMEAHKNKPNFQPTLDTPDVSDSWSLILPSIFGNTGGDIGPDKIHNTGTFTTPETETIELDHSNNLDYSLSKEDSNHILTSSSTAPEDEEKSDEVLVTEKITNTKTQFKNEAITTTSTTKTTTTSTTLKPVYVKPTTTTTKKPTTTRKLTTVPRPLTTTTRPTVTSSTPKIKITTRSPSVTKTPTSTKVSITTRVPSTTKVYSTTKVQSTSNITDTDKAQTTNSKLSTTQTRPATVTATTNKIKTTTNKPTTSTQRLQTTTTTMKPKITTTVKPITTTPARIATTTLKPTITQKITDNIPTSNLINSEYPSTESTTIKYEKISTFIPVSTFSYITEKTLSKQTQSAPVEITANTNEMSFPNNTTPVSETKFSFTTPPTSNFIFILPSTQMPDSETESDKINSTTITTQSVSPSTTASSTMLLSSEKIFVHQQTTDNPSSGDESSIPLFDVAQSISQIASDLGQNYRPIPTSSNLLDKTKISSVDLESKENFEIDIPNDSTNVTNAVTSHITTNNIDNFVKISTLDPHASNAKKEPEESVIQNRNENITDKTELTTVTATEKPTTDPFLSESMSDLLSQVVDDSIQKTITTSEKNKNEEVIISTVAPKIDETTTDISIVSTTNVIQVETEKETSGPVQNLNITYVEKPNKINDTIIGNQENVESVTKVIVSNVSTESTIDKIKNDLHISEPSDIKNVSMTGPKNSSLENDNNKSEITSTSKVALIEKQTESNKKIFTTDSPFNVKFVTIPSISGETVETSTHAEPVRNKFETSSYINKLNKEKIKLPELLPKIDDFKKKIQKVNIDDKELAAERNNSWKLIPTVTPPKSNDISKDKVKDHPAENNSHKDIVLEFSKENQGLAVTTKDLGEDIAQFTELCNELAFRYWNTIVGNIDKKRSFVLSPYSITSMLAMMFMGARGATSGEMNEVLKLDDMVTFNPHFTLKNISDSIETSPESGISVSAFIRELYSDKNKGKVLRFYKERAQQFYNGHVEEIDFKLIGDKIRRRTNLLVKRYTWGKMSEYIKTSTINMQPPLAAFSANIFETDCSGSSVEGRDGEMYFVVSPNVRQRRLVPVPAVVYRSGFLAGYDPVLDATAAALGNTDSIVSTLFLMPGQQGNVVHSEDLEALEKRILDANPSTPAWNRLLRTLLPRIGLELQIPRFSHKSMFNVSSTLRKMGLKDLFDQEHADLGGLIGPSKDLYLSDMIQSTTFVTCGEGIVADQHHIEEYPETLEPVSRRRSSRWAHDWDEPRDYQRAFHDPHDVGDAMHLPLHLRPRQARLPSRNAQPARLKFDRPFLYFVRHNPSGMILYVGRYNPRLLP